MMESNCNKVRYNLDEIELKFKHMLTEIEGYREHEILTNHLVLAHASNGVLRKRLVEAEKLIRKYREIFFAFSDLVEEDEKNVD